MKKESEEILPLVDVEGNFIGKASREECHSGSMLLHPVIHLHLINLNGELYLQKRSAKKEIEPNKWDSSVGGHIDLNETPEQTAIREAHEELNIDVSDIIYINKHIIKTQKEQELTYVYLIYSDLVPFVDKEEISEGRFWTFNEILEKIDSGIFTPNFIYDFKTYLLDKNSINKK